VEVRLGAAIVLKELTTANMKVRFQGFLIIAGSVLGFLVIRYFQTKTANQALGSQPVGAWFLVLPAMVGLLQMATGCPWDQILDRWNALPPKRQKFWAAVVLMGVLALLGSIAFWSIYRQIPS
jgi:hypothetical protein